MSWYFYNEFDLEKWECYDRIKVAKLLLLLHHYQFLEQI